MRKQVSIGRKTIRTDQYKSPGVEELMILAVQQILQAEHVEVPRPEETYWGNPAETMGTDTGIDNIRDLSVGHALLTLPSGQQEELLDLLVGDLPTEPKPEEIGTSLYKLMKAKNKADPVNTMGFDFILELLASRLDPDRPLTQDEIKFLKNSDFIPMAALLASYTREYSQVFKPYWKVFSDVASEKTAIGRIFHSNELAKLTISQKDLQTLFPVA